MMKIWKLGCGNEVKGEGYILFELIAVPVRHSRRSAADIKTVTSDKYIRSAVHVARFGDFYRSDSAVIAYYVARRAGCRIIKRNISARKIETLFVSRLFFLFGIVTEHYSLYIMDLRCGYARRKQIIFDLCGKSFAVVSLYRRKQLIERILAALGISFAVNRKRSVFVVLYKFLFAYP